MERGVIVGGLLIAGSFLLAVMLIGSVGEKVPPLAPNRIDCVHGDAERAQRDATEPGGARPPVPISGKSGPADSCPQ